MGRGAKQPGAHGVLRSGAMRGRALLLVAFVGMGSACLSPTLPLPPPTIDSAAESVTANLWGVSGTCLPTAFVQVLNTNVAPERGSVVECSSEGTYQTSVDGELCDVIVAQQSLNEDVSTDTRFVLEPFVNDAPVSTSACP